MPWYQDVIGKKVVDLLKPKQNKHNKNCKTRDSTECCFSDCIHKLMSDSAGRRIRRASYNSQHCSNDNDSVQLTHRDTHFTAENSPSSATRLHAQTDTQLLHSFNVHQACCRKHYSCRPELSTFSGNSQSVVKKTQQRIPNNSLTNIIRTRVITSNKLLTAYIYTEITSHMKCR